MLRKYGTETTIYFPLIDAGTRNFAGSGDYTHASGDVRISKDGAASATATNTPTVVTMNNGSMWKLTLTATEIVAEVVPDDVDQGAQREVAALDHVPQNVCVTTSSGFGGRIGG